MVCSIVVRIPDDIVPCIKSRSISLTTAFPVKSLVESACNPVRSIDVPAGGVPIREKTIVLTKLAC